MKKRGWWVLVLVILLVSTVGATKANSEIINSLEKNKEVLVVIMLKELPNLAFSSEKINPLDQRKIMIKNNQDKVLESLKLKQNQKLTLSSDYDFELRNRYSVINGFSGKITKSGLEKLSEDEKVKSIHLVKPIKPSLDDSIPLIKADEVWNVSLDHLMINGTGETVCVIDTGVDYTHPALGGCTNDTFLAGTCPKVISGYDYGDNDNDPYDFESHGTHVAGIVASENETYRGVAPGANIVALKVFSDAGVGDTDYAIAAIDWCVSNSSELNISVITMSIGVVDAGGAEIPYASYCDSEDSTGLAAAASAAVAQGIFVDVSAGNDKGTAGISSPACGMNVTSVAATTDDDQIIPYNTASTLDLLAPGSGIVSTIFNPNFGSKSGTSMAAPHVAGAAVLLKQYYQKVNSLSLTPTQIEDKLKKTGKLILDSRNGIEFPRIDILNAVRPIINFTADNPANDTTLITTSATINITAEINLSAALLEWDFHNGTITNYTMNENNKTNFYYTIEGLALGDHFYRVYANDSANTFGISESRTLEVDNTAPTINFYTPQNNSFQNQLTLLNITLTDALLDYSNYSVTNSSEEMIQSNSAYHPQTEYTWMEIVNFSNSTFSEDNYTLTVFVNDSLGNSAGSTINFTVDKTNPLIFNLSLTPATIYNNDTVIFRINVTDLYLNSSSVFVESNFSGSWANYSMSQQEGNTYNFTLSGTTNLTNQKNIGYQFFAQDYAGNLNHTLIENFRVQNRIPINLNITNPANGTVIEVGTTTQFNGAANDEDSDSLSYIWNFSDNTVFTTQQNPTHQFTSTGTFIIILNVSDGYSFNLTNLTVIVNDTKEPTISNNYDNSVHLESETNQSVTVTADDYSGISELKLFFNNSEQTRTCSTQNSTSWICAWKWGNFSVGNYNFTINATDNFSSTHTNSTTYPFSVTSCSDGAKNGDESGIDCGGSCSSPCGTSSSSSSGGGGGGGGGSGRGLNIVSELPPPVETVEETIEETTEIPAEEAEGTAETSEEILEVAATKEEESIAEGGRGALTGSAIFQGIKNVFVDYGVYGIILVSIVLGVITYLVIKRAKKEEEIDEL